MDLVWALLVIAAGFGGGVMWLRSSDRASARQPRLSASEHDRLALTIGSPLASMLDESIDLRERVDSALAKLREVAAYEADYGDFPRTRAHQLAEPNLVFILERLNEALADWRARLDALEFSDQQLVALLSLSLEPIRTLEVATSAGQPPDGALLLATREGKLAMIGRLDQTSQCLRRFERELIEYRTSGYR